MCLGLPGELVEVDGQRGVLDVAGRRVEVSLVFLPGAAVGSWVIAHAGHAVRLVATADAAAARRLLDEAVSSA